MSTRNRHQEGSLERAHRAKGPDVWVYRWRENGTQRKKVVGTVQRLKTLTQAKNEVENFCAQLNSRLEKIGRMTVEEAWGHFQKT
jgi:integrase